MLWIILNEVDHFLEKPFHSNRIFFIQNTRTIVVERRDHNMLDDQHFSCMINSLS